jgi:cell division protein FtsL
MSETSKGSGLTKVLIATNVITLIVAIFLFMKMNDKSQEIEKLNGTVSTQSEDIVAKTQELTNLNEDLERIKAEREKLGLSNDSLNQQISKLNSYISQIKKAGKIDAAKRAELEALISELRAEITKKDAEIASLSKANDSLSTNLNVANQDKARLGDSLSTKLKELAYASILKTKEIKVTCLKENGKELDKEEYKTKQIDRFKIMFKLQDNKAAKKNNKTFYVRLITPSGTAFSDANNGGGSFNTAEGESMLYTMSQDLAFDNTEQTITLLMQKGFNYVAGNYKVEVYCEGFKIGENVVKVKESGLFK